MNNNKYFSEFIDLITSFKSKKEFENFFKEILTPNEMEEIPTRLQIVKKLKQGIPQREIAEELRVGVATVTRGSRELQKGSFRNIE